MVEQREQVRLALAPRALQDQWPRWARTVEGAESGLDVAGRVCDRKNAVGGNLRSASAVRFDEGNGGGGQMLPSELAAQG